MIDRIVWILEISKGEQADMVILLFCFFLIFLVKMVGFALKASWSILKTLLLLVFIPFILVMLAVGGFVYVAFPLLIVFGIIGLFNRV